MNEKAKDLAILAAGVAGTAVIIGGAVKAAIEVNEILWPSYRDTTWEFDH